MSIILLFLLLIIVFILWFTTWIILRVLNPSLSKSSANGIILRVFVGLVFFVSVEQMFLSTVVNPFIIHNDAKIFKVIDKAKGRPGGLAIDGLRYCESSLVAILYSYNICLHGGFTDQYSGKQLIVLILYYPNGWLSVIPKDWVEERLLPTRFELLELNIDGEILKDLRSRK